MDNLFEIRFDATNLENGGLDQQMKILASLKQSHNEVAYIAPNGSVLNITTEYNHFVLTKNDKNPERFPYGLEDQLQKRLKENLTGNSGVALSVENEYKLIGPEDLIKVTSHLNGTDSHQFENDQEYSERVKSCADEKRAEFSKDLIANSGSAASIGVALLSLGATLRVASAGFGITAGLETVIKPLTILNFPFSQGALGLAAAGLTASIVLYRTQCKRAKQSADALQKVGKTVEKYSERVTIEDYDGGASLGQADTSSILDNIAVRTASSNNNDKHKVSEGAS